ncbi:MAG: UbiD family decarboxylase, partial [Fibrobacterales bacterium]|nr:UbiD family decarboxylase [Fibrobacterales bacterium]
MKTFGTADWARELERRGELLRVREQLSSDLELAALQRRLFRKGAPAVLVEHVEGSRFPAMANLYGTEARMKALFAGADDALEMLFAAHADLKRLLLAPKEWPRALRALADAL